MRLRAALTAIAAVLLCGPTAARAQSACDLPDPAIERVYIELVDTPTIPSGQLTIKVGDAPTVPRERAENGLWFLDLWSSGVLTPLPVSVLRADAVKVSKVGWTFTPLTASSPRRETIGGTPRCAVTLAFTATELWQVRVVAEPSGEAPAVPVECERFCGAHTSTDFPTDWMFLNERLQLKAVFAPGCEAPLVVSAEELRRMADGILRLPQRELFKRIPASCFSENYKLRAVRRRMPDEGISFRQVVPR